MAAPAPAPASSTGPIDQKDIDHWSKRFNEVLAKPSETLNSKSPEDAREWNNAFCGCLNPIDTCLITYCLPCVTFGKTHHRTMKNSNMEGYEPINTSCLLFCGSLCFGLHWIPLSMQRAEIRRKYHLQGNCLTDIAAACCCALCNLVQQEKESEFREKELTNNGQYKGGETMVYAKQ